MTVLFVIAAVLNAVGLLLMFGNSYLSKERHLRNRPLATWLSGTVPIAVGAVLIFIGVALAMMELQRQLP